MILIIVFQDLPVERMFDFQDFPGSNFQDFPETGQNRVYQKGLQKGGNFRAFQKGKKIPVKKWKKSGGKFEKMKRKNQIE